jgi:hypothetical protein
MDWGSLTAIAIAIPIVFFPGAFVWYLSRLGYLHQLHRCGPKMGEAATSGSSKGGKKE